jgi:thioredoxin-like negative regulator of GroEL
LRVVKVDVDSNAELAQQFSIRSIPTMVFFRDGEIVDRLSGALPKQALSKRFDALVEKPRAF